MKSLLPSLKEKKRYVIYQIVSADAVMENDVNETITKNFEKYMGNYGLATAGMQFISNKWNQKSMSGILRVSNNSVDALKASFTFIHSINNKKVVVRSLGTSGILIKAQKKYLAK